MATKRTKKKERVDEETGEVLEEGTSPAPVSIAERRKRLKAMAKLSDGFKGWGGARKVLTRVRSVPTIFPQFDRATRVGGLPIERVTVVHGPSNQGKTLFALGLILSFLDRDHFASLVDAELTTPASWLEKLMGEQLDHPGFVAKRENTFEDVVDSVREFATMIGKARGDGVLPEDTTGLAAVDSLRKLVPKEFTKRIGRHGASSTKGSVDGFSGRGSQFKAKLNADWFDELTQLLWKTKTAMLVISRESKDLDADQWDRKAERDFKVGGGSAVVYDASLVARISRDRFLEVEVDGQRVTIGERIKVRIWKTKVGGKEHRVADAFFHTSNGSVAPEGFWRSRDVLELAEFYGIVTTSGSWLKWGTFKKWQGREKVVAALDANPEWLERMEGEVRERFARDDLSEQVGEETPSDE